MDLIVKKLSEIEHSAVAIVKNAESQKMAVENEMIETRRHFDEFLNIDTERKLEQIRAGLETKMESELKEQKKSCEHTIETYKQEYETNCEQYAHDILARITEV